jgi:hypothetical protein
MLYLLLAYVFTVLYLKSLFWGALLLLIKRKFSIEQCALFPSRHLILPVLTTSHDGVQRPHQVIALRNHLFIKHTNVCLTYSMILTRWDCLRIYFSEYSLPLSDTGLYLTPFIKICKLEILVFLGGAFSLALPLNHPPSPISSCLWCHINCFMSSLLSFQSKLPLLWTWFVRVPPGAAPWP